MDLAKKTGWFSLLLILSFTAGAESNQAPDGKTLSLDNYLNSTAGKICNDMGVFGIKKACYVYVNCTYHPVTLKANLWANDYTLPPKMIYINSYPYPNDRPGPQLGIMWPEQNVLKGKQYGVDSQEYSVNNRSALLIKVVDPNLGISFQEDSKISCL